MSTKSNQKIAVVGIGSLFPDAKNTNEFWENILNKKVSIKELPDHLFEKEIYYRPELRKAFNKQDKSYTKIAGFLEDIDFNTVRKFKIPPSVAEHMDPNQHAALYTADEALKNINLENIAKEKVSVIYGNGSVGSRYGDAIVSVQYEKIKHYLRKHPLFEGISEKEQEELFEYVRANALTESIPLTEDSAPGILPNIIAARVSNVFDFNGPSYTVDSACASSLTAIISGVKGLRLNEIDMAVCGGSDMPIKSLGLIFFSAINALSPDGSFPFDVRANGFVMGQGSGTVVLKRLEDAVRDKDKIYSVINGYGEASDGKGKYIAAPNADWQAHSITKACEMAGYSADTIELIEAHGTGTIVGDVVELDGLKTAFNKLGYSRNNYCGVSSVKSNIGHLKSAAGIAGFIKAVLSLDNKKLPATANLETINPKLELENSPFYILGETKEWKENPNHPRRANVSAFGFGGADYHLALEEYRKNDYSSRNYSIDSAQFEPVQQNISTKANDENEVTTQVVYFSANNLDELLTSVDTFLQKLKNQSAFNFSEFIKYHNLNTSAEREFRLALVVNSLEEIDDKAKFFKENHDRLSREVIQSKGIFYKSGNRITPEQTAILFPGQAAQYANMLNDVKNSSDVFAGFLDKADAFWLANNGNTISSLIYGDDNLNEHLKETQNTHPAVFATSMALFEYLKNLGLKAEYMVGHSLGEITALAASGILNIENALRLVNARGYSFVDAKLPDNGKMLSVSLEKDLCEQTLKDSKIENVSVANINSTKQIILAGTSEGIDQLVNFLKDNNIDSKRLNVSHAFHTDLMKPVSNIFKERISDVEFSAGNTKVLMNHTGDYYPTSKKELKKLNDQLADQILQPVNFVRSIEKLKNNGVKLFVEVGPNSILGSLTKNILNDDNVTVLSANHKKVNSIKSFQKLQAGLFAEGINLNPLNVTSSKTINTTVASNITQSTTVKNIPLNERSVVYSGVSIGLPGSYKEMFQDDNFTQIFEGRNFIERMTDEEKQNLVDLSVTKLVKDEKGPVFKLLSTLDDVIQLSGKSGKLDIVKDYKIDDNEIKKMTKTISMGIAAAYEALKDAKIPLVQEFTKTTSGKYLPGKLALPKNMQNDTGVIFANGFPMVDPIIEEVSRHVAYEYGSKNSSELIKFYESIIEKVKDDEAKKLLSNWFTLYYSRLSNSANQNDIYKFNYNFITQISSQANNRVAQLLNAKGPNFQMNAACASTSNAITIAEDFIKTGRVKRMIIIGADDATSKTNMPYLGAGFLSSGAATIEGDLYKAAVPFDVKRNGMIMSAGAVGLIVEDQNEVRSRGVNEICELVGSHSFNTANHPSQIDSDGFSYELNRFISKVEQNKNLKRKNLAEDLIYISHETYTPPRGGCSQTEAIALSDTFKDGSKNIIIGNTKGMTGHAMGAALEEAIAAKALQYGKVPPVVNLTQKDPLLSDLHISTGENHNKNYALRMSAGFGAQGNYILLKKVSDGENRITDKEKYQNWLKEISGNENPTESLRGKILVVDTDSSMAQNIKEPEVLSDRNNQEKELTKETPTPENIIETLSTLTKYPPEMLEDEMEFDSDLGIEKERLIEITQFLQNKYDLEELNISGDSLIEDLLNNILKPVRSRNVGTEVTPTNTAEIDSSKFDDEVKNEVVKIFSEVTKYPEDMLDLDMEMEADLGIDTVKQATILSMIGEKYQIERDDDLRLSDFPTIGHMIDLVYNTSNLDLPKKEIEDKSPTNDQQISSEVKLNEQDEDLKSEVLKVFSEVTKYPEDMLELDMEMEADLGIDTVKQATILSILGEKYMLDQNEDMRLSDYPTIGHIISLVKENGKVFLSETEYTEVKSEDVESINESVSSTSSQTHITELSKQTAILSPSKLGKKTYSIKSKNVFIIGNVSDTVEQLKKYLVKNDCEIQTYVFPATDNVQELKDSFSKIDNKTTIDILIDSTNISINHKVKDFTDSSVESESFINVKSRFLLYKTLIGEEFSPDKIICLLSEDGTFGLDDKSKSKLNLLNGAINGFYKSLRKEISIDLKVIDFSHELLISKIDFVYKTIINEIEKRGLGFEIGYKNSARKVLKITDVVDDKLDVIDFGEDDVFLISGGASGVTFEIVKGLANKYNAKFVLIGRTKLPTNISDLNDLTDNQFEELRNDIRARLGKNSDRVTPKMINDEYDQLKRSVTIYRNIKSVGEERVRYISADITNYEDLKNEISKLPKKFKLFTALIHGAGIDKSNLLNRKSLDDFNLVFDTKVIGAINLTKVIDLNTIKLAVGISSISGRFGNAAQTDYSSANNFISSWIRKLGLENPKLRTFSFLTSGWDEVGMAWRNTFVREGSEELGLNLLNPNLAVKYFLDEINIANSGKEVIIHKGLNGFIEDGLSESNIEKFPLLDRIVSNVDDNKKAFRMISVKRDAMLDQHRLGDTPIMPAVGYSELGAEYLSLRTSLNNQFLFKQISFENPFKLFKEKAKELFVHGSEDSNSDWQIEIQSKFNLANSDITNLVTHSKMTLSNNIGNYEDMDPKNWNLDKKNSVSLPASESLMLIEGQGPKQRIILGPLYNDIVRDTDNKAAVTIFDDSVVYPTNFPMDQLSNDKYPLESMLVNPCFLDTLYQSCAAHLLVTRKRVYLPWLAEDLGIVDVPKEDGVYTCHGQLLEETEDIVKYRVTMLDENKNIRYFVRSIEFRKINL